VGTQKWVKTRAVIGDWSSWSCEAVTIVILGSICEWDNIPNTCCAQFRKITSQEMKINTKH
jgi:hypothetical protein